MENLNSDTRLLFQFILFINEVFKCGISFTLLNIKKLSLSYFFITNANNQCFKIQL